MKHKRLLGARQDKQFVVTRAVPDAPADDAAETNRDAGTITVEVEDRGGDIVVASGGRLENFLKNPVVLYAHNSGRMPGYGELPIARATTLTIENDRINAEWEWAPHPEAQVIKSLWRGGFLNAISIGFLPEAYVELDGGDDWWPPLKFTQWELLEFSIVPIPANQDALRLALDDYDAGRPARLKGIVQLAGRVLSAANEANLQQARDLIDGVLTSAQPADDDKAATGWQKDATPEPAELEADDEAAAPADAPADDAPASDGPAPADVVDNSDPGPTLDLDYEGLSHTITDTISAALTAAIRDALADALGASVDAPADDDASPDADPAEEPAA